MKKKKNNFGNVFVSIFFSILVGYLGWLGWMVVSMSSRLSALEVRMDLRFDYLERETQRNRDTMIKLSRIYGEAIKKLGKFHGIDFIFAEMETVSSPQVTERIEIEEKKETQRSNPSLKTNIPLKLGYFVFIPLYILASIGLFWMIATGRIRIVVGEREDVNKGEKKG